MPQLIIRGVEVQPIKKISKNLIDELQEIIGCPRDYFTLEIVPTISIMDGVECTGRTFVQVNWFERGQDIQDKVAQSIDCNLRSVGYEQAEVFFTVLQENRYYENGTHY